MTDRKAIPLEAALEWWGMLKDVKGILQGLYIHLTLNAYQTPVKKQVTFLLQKIDELEGEK